MSASRRPSFSRKPTRSTVLGLLCILLAMYGRNVWRRYTPLPHLRSHSATFHKNLLTPKQGRDLLALVKSFASLQPNVDTNHYHATHEHIGEAKPIEADGRCPDTLLVPNRNRTLCVFPGRMDIAKHYLLYGGLMGFKESAPTSISRLFTFSQYEFDTSAFGPVARDLFESDGFQRAAREVCPPDKQLLDPVQVSFIVQLPGMSVPLHLDAPYFKGASRFQLPVWLLAVMKFSGLFEDAFVDQVQIVAYLHDWQPDSATRASEFTYFNDADGTVSVVEPHPLGGTAVDGSKVVHAARTYMPHVRPPVLRKEHQHSLQHVGDDEWTVTTAEVPDRVLRYKTSELRIATVYRARCFASARERRYFRRTVLTGTTANADADIVDQDGHDDDDQPETYGVWTLDHVLTTLTQDLIARGVVKDAADAAAMSRLRLGELLMNTYVHYPRPLQSYIFPWNYCLLGEVVPALRGALSYVCA